ncbi:MAG: hypothetical protein ACE5D3_00605 [Candidatus Binatia bacterium]
MHFVAKSHTLALAQDLGVGRVLDVRVNEAKVGQITMLCADSADPCMNTQGELEFDDTAGPNDMDDPFPPSFPAALTSGSSIDVQGVLGGVF